MLTKEGLFMYVPLDGSGNSSGKWPLTSAEEGTRIKLRKLLAPVGYEKTSTGSIFYINVLNCQGNVNKFKTKPTQ